MIKGIGTDILQISRMAKSLQRTPRLAERILTASELACFHTATNQPLFLAKRFSAKEAIVKALGTGIGRGVGWQHIEITKDANGKPEVQLTSGALLKAQQSGIGSMHLSYSDEKEYVVAFAVAEEGKV